MSGKWERTFEVTAPIERVWQAFTRDAQARRAPRPGVRPDPNADVKLVGGSDFYGEILGATVTDTGGTHFHYDRSLKKNGYAPSNHMLSAFTWRKY